MASIILPGPRKGVRDHLGQLHWPLIIALSLIALAGVFTLYSVAGGSLTPWAGQHAVRFAVSLVVLGAVGFIGIRFWQALAYPIYFVSLGTLALVPFIGAVNMGAQRWIEFGGMQFQPSEGMKLALVLGLARYYQSLRIEQVSQLLYLVPPALMIGAPVGLVFIQPDLGTAILLALSGASIVFLAGVSWRIIVLAVMGVIAAGYGAWRFEILKPYQLERIFTFLDPDRDPLGKGYHLTQSKIGLGSGGLEGKGFMEGTQSELKFLPEMQTDFIFTIFGEEFGFIGAVGLLMLYFTVIVMGVNVAMRARTHFARLTTMGVVVTFALYVLINTAMVMGMAPVVGVPLPLVSYGGTVMLTIMTGFGLVMSAHLAREGEGYGGL